MNGSGTTFNKKRGKKDVCMHYLKTGPSQRELHGEKAIKEEEESRRIATSFSSWPQTESPSLKTKPTRRGSPRTLMSLKALMRRPAIKKKWMMKKRSRR